MNSFQDLPNEQLLEVLAHTKTATAVHTGELAYIRFANQAMLDIWDKDGSMIGKSLEQALPELKGQPFIAMFAKVFREGLTIKGTDTPAHLKVDGRMQTFYFDFEYRAILDGQGKSICVLHTATDVTDRFLKQQAQRQAALSEESLAREQALNEELAATNEELSSALEELTSSNEQLMRTKTALRELNEQLEQRVRERVANIAALNEQLRATAERYASLNAELAAVNEELTVSNEELVETYEKLKLSQQETQLAISAAGMATFDLDPLSGHFSGNQQLKEWFGLGPEQGIDLQKATGAIAKQDRRRVVQAISDALSPSSGGNYNVRYTIGAGKRTQQRIVQAWGRTIFDQQGTPKKLSGVLLDVTDQVLHSTEIAEANARLNIALEAGSLGSTEVDLASGKMECNPQFKRIFGRPLDQAFTYPELFAAMLPEYRENIRALVAAARENRSIYRAEYQVSWPDGSVHWISAQGKARYDSKGRAVKMVGIISDITEAKADEQRKNDFIAMVSHELKTPLTSLTGYVQLLHRNAKLANDTFTSLALQKADNQLTKMTRMINSFLNVSRLESGKIHIQRTEFDLNGLLAELESELGYTQQSHTLVFKPLKDSLINADREKIGHVLSNLISNAIKYSPAGSTVSVLGETTDGEIRVSVFDQGSGIRPEDRPFIFDRYYRVSDQSTTISGFGIGLYLCAEIIQRHQGRIWVESELGKGSTFRFALPLGSAQG